MKILYAGFKGENNSAKILLDKMDVLLNDKLYLTNSFSTSEKELKNKLAKEKYDLVIGIGQLKLDRNVIRIERCARGEECFETSYDYRTLKKNLEKEGFEVEESFKTNYLCNNIYYCGLKYIRDCCLDTKMVFIHVPKINKIDHVELLARVFRCIG